MKILLFILLISCRLFSEVEYKGNIGFEAQKFIHDISNKRDNSLAFYLETEFKKKFYSSEIVVKIKGMFDKDDKNRRYVDFNDLYYLYNFENSDILIGRTTLFWGALEFYNISDVFNSKDFLDDLFDYSSKLGSWNIAYTRYFENSEISIITKLYEERQKMQDLKSINYFFLLPYDDDLITQKDRFRPTIFLKYSGFGDEIQIDYSFIYQNGYDNQRYMIVQNGKLRQNAYLVNKLLGFLTLVIDDTIYKAEAAFAKSDDKKVSDYVQFGVGIEHTLYGIWDKKDLGLLLEYYRYESDQKIQNFFENDLVIGTRILINDVASSSILAGLDIDLENKEKIFILKYDTRVFDSYKLVFSYQKLSPKRDSIFKELDQIKFEFSYYF